MNTFKFRVWDKEKSKFNSFLEDGFHLILLSNGELRRQTGEGGSYWVNDEKFVIQQFIDLQDSTGRDIYEGDIVEALSSDNRYLSKIVWCKNDSRFGAESINLRHNSKTISYNLSMGCSRWKIVGNIYENPELTALDKYKP